MSLDTLTPAPRPAPPLFVALRGPFLRRSALMALLTGGLVAAFAAVYFDRQWAGIYLVAAVWSLGFFGLTPFIIKALVFDQQYGRGLALAGLKIFWMGVLFALCVLWTRDGGGGPRFGSALIAGISTPLVVVVLRVLGGGTPQKTSDPARNAAKEPTA